MSDDKRFHARLFWLQSGARKLFQTHRVGVCCRVTIPKRKVEIWGDVKLKKAKYRNVIRCASVWHCPVCSNNITAHRRNEIETVISVYREMTLPVMISFTIRHGRYDRLEDTLRKITVAWRGMTSCRCWSNMKKEMLVGYVRALEVTWGKSNGWHPHFHALFFLKRDANLNDFYDDIKIRWAQAVCDAGASSNEYATRMSTTDDSVAGYIAKWGHEPREETLERLSHWGQAAELTRGGMKQSKTGHLVPFDMIELFLTRTGDRQKPWAALVKEYGEAMAGQRQISWSRNPDMRQEAGIKKDLSNEEIVEGVDAGYYLLATIEPEQWQAILWAGVQGTILDCAARGDNDMMQGIISDCQSEHLKAIDRV